MTLYKLICVAIVIACATGQFIHAAGSTVDWRAFAVGCADIVIAVAMLLDSRKKLKP